MRYLLSVMLIISIFSSAESGGKKTLLYYAQWQNNSHTTSVDMIAGGYGYFNGSGAMKFPIDSIQLQGLDYIVYFTNGPNVSTSSPYYLEVNGGSDSVAYFAGAPGSGNTHALDSLVAKATRRGVRVFAEAVDLSGTTLDAIAADSTTTQRFADAVVPFLQRHGFTGLDVNKEAGSATTAQMTMFARIIKRKMDAVFGAGNCILMFAIPPGSYTTYTSAMDAYVDIFFVEMAAAAQSAYSGCTSSNVSWFTNAYTEGTVNCGPGGSPGNIVTPWYTTAHPLSLFRSWMSTHNKAKLMLYVWGGGSTYAGTNAVLTPFSYQAWTSNKYIRLYQANRGTTLSYDSERKAGIWSGTLNISGPYIGYCTDGRAPGQSSGEQTFVSFVNDSTIKYTHRFLDSSGCMGMGFYDAGYLFDEGYAPGSGRMLQLESAIRYAAPSGVLFTPTVTTTAISAITGTTATGGGNVMSDGGATVTARGVCWSTSANPTTANSKTSDATGTGSFTSALTGLTIGTLYHVRAYATNSVGTSYGSDVSFTTVALPTFSSASVTSIAQTTATGSANNNSAGGGSVTLRGWVVGTNANPAIGGVGVTQYNSNNPTGTGAYSTSITGLTASTAYNGRAFAINEAGTAYSSNVAFNTIGAPIVGTTVVSNITKNSATFTVSINNNGTTGTTQDSFLVGTTQGGPYTTRVVGSPSTSTGTTNTTVTYNITGLTSGCSTLGSTYYVRGQGTNGIGTTLGVEVAFTTLPAMSMYSQEELDSAKAFAYSKGDSVGFLRGQDYASILTQRVTLRSKGGKLFDVILSIP